MRNKNLAIISLIFSLALMSGCGTKDASEANTNKIEINVSMSYDLKNNYPDAISKQLEIRIYLMEDGKYLRTDNNNQLTLNIGETTYDLNSFEYKHHDSIFGSVRYHVDISEQDFEEVDANIVFNTSERLSLDFKIPQIISVETNMQPNYSPDNDNLVIDWRNVPTSSKTTIRISQNSSKYESPSCSKYIFESNKEIYSHRIDAGEICQLDNLGGVLYFMSTPISFDYINNGFKKVSINHSQNYIQSYTSN